MNRTSRCGRMAIFRDICTAGASTINASSSRDASASNSSDRLRGPRAKKGENTLNIEQKTQYVAFMANFIKVLSEEKMPRAHAQQAALAAASCLFAAVFELCPRDDTEVEDFSVPVIRVALNSFYGLQADRAMLN